MPKIQVLLKTQRIWPHCVPQGPNGAELGSGHTLDGSSIHHTQFLPTCGFFHVTSLAHLGTGSSKLTVSLEILLVQIL